MSGGLKSPLQKALRVQLLRWFAAVRRPFPWREEPTPYRVLVSEIMLQQTQAIRVIDFFERWMARFPSFQALAAASEADVIKTWEGLGYYSRARALHAIATIVCSTYNGLLPSTSEELLALPGIGPYTAGALLSFAFHQRAIAIDANVARVLGRCFGEKDKKKLPALLNKLLPHDEPWKFLEALIELGALCCCRLPACTKCPIAAHCYSCAHPDLLAPPQPSQKIIRLFRDVCVFRYAASVLVVKRSGKTIMSGLHEFPFFETMPEGRSPQELCDHIESTLHCTPVRILPMASVTHSFTRYRATLYPAIVEVTSPFDFQDGLWMPPERLSDLPFSSGHRKVLQALRGFRPLSILVEGTVHVEPGDLKPFGS